MSLTSHYLHTHWQARRRQNVDGNDSYGQIRLHVWQSARQQSATRPAHSIYSYMASAMELLSSTARQAVFASGAGGRTMIMSPAHRKLFVYGCCLPLRIIFRVWMPARPPLSSIGIAAVITQQIGRSHGDQTQLQRMRRTGTERKTRNKREERGVAGTGRREGGKGPPVWATGHSRTSYPESQNFSHFAFSFCRLPPQQA